jgi:outer membrane protein
MRIQAIMLASVAMLATVPAQAEQGDWLIRARAIRVAPNDDAGSVNPSFPGGTVSVDNSYMPEVDFTYMATDHIGAELILATTKHHVSGRGSLGGLGKIASTWVLPPTLTLQYHLAPTARIRPYVGAGVNYTIFYSGKSTDNLESVIGDTSVRMKDSFGYALQAGVDFDLTKKVFANFDIKYVDMDTTARLNTGGAINRVKVHLDPIILGVGIGMRF